MDQLAKLSAIEARIIRSMLTKEYGPDSTCLDQLASAEIGKREMTGTGFYADFILSADAPRMDSLNGNASEAYKTLLPAPRDLVGFTVFIRDGHLSWFEGYTFGDVKWPDEPIESWLVLDAA